MKWLLRIKVSEGANEKLRQWSTLYTCSDKDFKSITIKAVPKLYVCILLSVSNSLEVLICSS